GPDPEAGSLAGGKLDDGLRTPSPRRTPRPDVGRDLQHLAVAREKDSVDGKTHEKHVNRPRGAKQQPLSRLQGFPPEQSPHPRQRIVGDRAAFANDLPVNGPNRNLSHKRRPMDRSGSCAEAGFAGRERKPPPSGAFNTTRGLAGETGFPPRVLVGEAQASPTRLVTDVNVVVVVGEGERRAAEPEQ